ncbi:MAG: glycosyltransferase [Candidatus Roizmanbacteria bacterium]|nr:glycosyltransferase [Candidatus Roizmanbacteria bacterium]
MYNSKTKIAIVYDWIDKWGGVERVLLHLHTLFPDAHFYTSAVEYKNAQWAKGLTIHPSFIQTFPSFLRMNRALMAPLFPFAFESFSFGEYDLVISVTSAFAKGIITKPGTKHVCYLLTPPRYLWSHTKDYMSGFKGFFALPFLHHLQQWDLCAAHRPDKYISISTTTAQRAKRYYQIESQVVHPPFDTDYWDIQKKSMKKPKTVTITDSYYLCVGRMESYKKTQLVVDAAKQKPSSQFIFVGTGSLERKLRSNSPQNCQFAGLITDSELSYLYAHAKALIMPQNEDFGYISLEAQYHGCPVIAYHEGGASETVTEGESGLFFKEQTVPCLTSQLERFEQISYNLSHSTGQIQQSMKERFGSKRFDAQFLYQLQ